MAALTSKAPLLALAFVLAPGVSRAQEPVRRPAEPVPWPADTIARPAPVLPVPVLPSLPSAEEPGWPWIVEPAGYHGLTIEHYNRTDGLTPAIGLSFEPRDPARAPELALRLAAATTHSELYATVRVRQRLPVPGAVYLRGEWFRRSATFDDWKVSIHENDAAVLLLGSDLLDWWREQGFELAVDAESPSGRYGVTLALFAASQRSQPDRSPFALFSDETFRPNPAVAEGDLHSWTLTGRVDTRDVQSPLLPAPGWKVEANWERAGGAIGGDLAFSRGRLDVRRYTRIGRDAWWDGRVVWMGRLSDTPIPPQRHFAMGGPGSLRGFPAAAYVAEEGVQATSELRLPLPVNDRIALLFLSWHAVGFVDAGRVGDGDWHADVGTGFSGINIFSYLGFFVAQRVTDADEPDSGPRFIVRLRRDF